MNLTPDECCGDLATNDNCICLDYKNPLYLISFILTTVGVAFILSTIFILRIPKTPLTHLILGISLCDFVFTGAIFLLNQISVQLNESLCGLFVLISQIGMISSFAWAVCFTHACQALITAENPTNANVNTVSYFGISLGVGIVSSITAIIFGFAKYYPDGDNGTCVHLIGRQQLDLSAFLGTNIQFVGCVGLSIYFSIRSIRGLNQVFGGTNFHRWIVILKYPVVLLICWIPLQMGHMLYQFGINSSLFNNRGVSISEVICLSQGFVNAFVYGISNRTVTGYKELCRSRYKKQKNDEVMFKNDGNSLNEGFSSFDCH